MIVGAALVCAPVSAVSAAERCGAAQFGVRNISIDQSAATASEARSLGIRAAAETGFDVVITRLLHNPVTVAAFLDTHDLDEFTDFVHITAENSLEGRYIGMLDFCFDADRLRQAFKRAELPWAEQSSPPILVLPVWQAPDGARAWQPDNEWLAGWRDAVNASTGLVRFVLLKPTIANERRLRAAKLASGDMTTLQRAAQMSGADQVMVVIAQLDYAGSAPVLNVSGQLFSAAGEQLTQLANMADMPVTDGLATQLDEARADILAQMESSWHAANALSGTDGAEVTVTVPIASLQDWSSRLSVLAKVPAIEAYKIRMVGIDQGVVTITLAGSLATVNNALSPHRLKIEMLADNRAILSAQQPE